MPERKGPQTGAEILAALYEFAHGPEEDVSRLPLEKVLKRLKAEGIDAAPLISLVTEQLAAEAGAAKLAEARQVREKLLRVIEERKEPYGAAPRVRERLREIIGGLGQGELAVAYRKFEASSEADVESLLEDLEALDQAKKMRDAE